MEDLFERLLEEALQCNITIFDFWEMTYGEIVLVLRAHSMKKKASLKQLLSLNHSMADLIGASVARLMNKDAKYPTLYEAFPTVFEEERSQEQAREQAREWLIYKERLMTYANAHNKKVGESHHNRRAPNSDNSRDKRIDQRAERSKEKA